MDAYQTALAEHRPDLWPIYDRIFAGIGNVHIALGNYDEARNNFNIAIWMTDRDTRHVAEALSGLATVYEEYEEYDEAREALESAAAMYERLEMHEKAEEARTRVEKLPFGCSNSLYSRLCSSLGSISGCICGKLPEQFKETVLKRVSPAAGAFSYWQ